MFKSRSQITKEIMTHCVDAYIEMYGNNGLKDFKEFMKQKGIPADIIHEVYNRPVKKWIKKTMGWDRRSEHE